ncbi:reverse transcriptase domain-containing protein [Bifidobacterium catenulatum]|nr:reverse transcriptase domain-containing protein [Bifidobacterium catenulatum]MDH7890735.1 reverse transcriptase domain-containing protein [Bifidobacterium catenulatum subsp. kashiwanohense]
MQPTIEILDRIRKNSRDNKEEIFTRLYRYLLRPDLYYLAYKNLYANKGAGTKGVNDDTADGFSKEKVDRIIQSLADGTYTPNPVRREYIQKKQNSTKKRPLGIPTFTDKLVQEVLRMILESVYEPIFSNNSHGFRPNRSCHTALKSLKREFSGVSWFIEGDIKGCFDNIDHQVLANVINAKIKVDIMNYISVKAASEKWGISERRIQKLCEENRIDGTEKFGRAWMIPKDAEKPVDGRMKTRNKQEENHGI